MDDIISRKSITDLFKRPIRRYTMYVGSVKEPEVPNLPVDFLLPSEWLQ